MSGDRWWDPRQSGGGPGATGTGLGGGTGAAPKVGDAIETPYGTLLVTGVDEFGNPHYQYLSPRTTAEPGSGASFYAQQQENARSAASIAEQQRQFNEKMGMDKARGDQQMRLSQAQQALAEAEAAGFYNGQPTERAREFNTTNALDYYKWLANTASNPRNFVESFYTMRGQTPPQGAGQYSNLNPVRGFGQNFMQGLPGSSRYQGPPSPYSPSASAAPAPLAAGAPSSSIPVGAGGSISDWSRAHGYSAAGAAPSYGGSPTTADTAMINGVKTWAGGPYSGRPVDQSPANAGDLTPYLRNPGTPDPTGRVDVSKYLPQMMARGGEVTMTHPHALVDMTTGRVRAIAGEAGREHARFDGAAIIDPFRQGQMGAPTPTPDYTAPSTPTSDVTPTAVSPTSPSTPATGASTTTTPPSGTSLASVSQTTPPPPGFHWVGQQLVPDGTMSEATAPPAPPPPTDTTAPPSGPYYRPIDIVPGQSRTPDSTIVPNATPSGQSGNFWGGGSIKNYLPTFLPGEDSGVLGQMQQQGVVPPFLNRIFGQQQGAKDIGTNTPNPMELPKSVPLVSRMAYDQMLPTERQAFESYLSSYGIDPQDYWSYVDYVSPHGPTASQPLFGNRFQYQGQ